jgi:hypothetical protein
VARFELDMKRRGDEIERRTREVDGLNRRYERMVAAQPGAGGRKAGGAEHGQASEAGSALAADAGSTQAKHRVRAPVRRLAAVQHSGCALCATRAAPVARTEAASTGPLEAAIRSLARDIEARGAEGRELQRRWMSKQTELVALQVWGRGGRGCLASPAFLMAGCPTCCFGRVPLHALVFKGARLPLLGCLCLNGVQPLTSSMSIKTHPANTHLPPCNLSCLPPGRERPAGGADAAAQVGGDGADPAPRAARAAAGPPRARGAHPEGSRRQAAGAVGPGCSSAGALPPRKWQDRAVSQAGRAGAPHTCLPAIM